MCSCRFCVHICKGFASLQVIRTTFSLDSFWLLISSPASLIIPMYKQRGCHGTPWAVFVTPWKFLHFVVSASVALTLTLNLSISKKNLTKIMFGRVIAASLASMALSVFSTLHFLHLPERHAHSIFFYCMSFIKTYLFFKTFFFKLHSFLKLLHDFAIFIIFYSPFRNMWTGKRHLTP